MKYGILLFAVSLATFGAVDILLASNGNQETLVSCRRSKDQPPENPKSGRDSA